LAFALLAYLMLQGVTSLKTQLERHAAIAVIGHVVLGAEAGYFAGWAVVFLNRYRNAAKPGIAP